MKPKNPYTFFNRFCLRTPLLPLEVYHKLTEASTITTEKLKEIWNDKVVKEAIFLASPELFEAIEKWLDASSEDIGKTQRLQYTLLKYISRMSSRCTPFGLFAGCSIGEFGETTKIELSPYIKNKRQTRFDMNFLVALSQKLSKEEHIKKQLLWYPNTSIYKIGHQYRYVEYAYNQYNNREHSIEAVEHNPYLEMVLKHARSGMRTNELANILVDDDVTIEEAKSFIDELILNQILVSELEPSVTGEDFLVQLSHRLKKLKDTTEITAQMKLFQEFTDRVDKQLGNAPEAYIALSESIKATATPFELKYLFQADMYTHTVSNTLDIHWGYKIKRLMTFLDRMSPTPQNTRLQQFKSAFLKRYETREIPLALVLDTETGIGYLQDQEAVDSIPFLEDLNIPARRGSQQSLSWNPVQEIIYKKLREAVKTNEYTLQLHDRDFEHLEVHWNDLPDTMSAMVEMVRINGEEKAVLSHIGGSSAANLLGRFSTDPAILNYVQDIVTAEKQMQPNRLMAEIIHLPQSRTGNVIRRAALRDYEIPYLAKSGLPQEQQISIDDLLISVKNDTVVLRSERHNKEVLPRLTNAHNYSGGNSLPIYHFLCDLQQQKLRSGIGFHWGEIQEKNSFLPRVTYKDFILSKARWKITEKDIAPLLNKEDSEDRIAKVTAWRTVRQIPKLVQLTDSDNTLLINLENEDAVEMWLNTVKNRNYFILKEFLFSEESSVRQNNLQYTNQFVISFYNEEKRNKKS